MCLSDMLLYDPIRWSCDEMQAIHWLTAKRDSVVVAVHLGVKMADTLLRWIWSISEYNLMTRDSPKWTQRYPKNWPSKIWSGIVHHKSDRKSCVIPTADRNSGSCRKMITNIILPATLNYWDGPLLSQSNTWLSLAEFMNFCTCSYPYSRKFQTDVEFLHWYST